jgi:hypothetical protein
MRLLTHAFDDGAAGAIRIGAANDGDTVNLRYAYRWAA